MDSELERLQKKVENYPSPSAYTRLAELQRDAGDRDAALRTAQRCIREFPRGGQAYVVLAQIHLADGDDQQAVTLLNQAIQQDPRCVSAFLALGDRAESTGDLDNAARYIAQAATLRPRDSELGQRAEALRQQAGGTQTLATANTASEAPPAAAQGDSGMIDLSGGFGAMTSAPAATPGAQPSSHAQASTPAPAPAAAGPLTSIMQQPGVSAAVVADEQGRTLVAAGFEPGHDDVFAALACDVTGAASNTLEAAGGQALRTWTVVTGTGQAVAFRRDSGITLVVLAERKVKTAMLELQARQVLLDLGAN